MKIGLVSDLHSDTGSAMPDIPEDVDILIAAGDMGDPFKLLKKLEKIKNETGIPYAYIAGNHEFYHYKFDYVMDRVFNNTRGCYNNYTLEFMDKRIHLCTLWTDIPDRQGMSMYIDGLNDSRMINGGLWSAEEYRREFNKSMKFLEEDVREGDIVVTHHSVSSSTVNHKFIGNPYNHCFFTDLDDFIKERKPALWCCGHMHDPYDGMVGDTRIVINPRGYRHEYTKRAEYQVKVLEV